MRKIGHILSMFLLAACLTAVRSDFSFAQTQSAVELKCVVIDAGHGGKDPGAPCGKIFEKDITLSVALKLGEMIRANYPSVKVIFTRSSDRFVPLYDRADIANRNHADLFISIHVNSATNRSAKGHETYVMGTEKNNANMEVCQRENSVVVLEDDYSSKYAGFNPNDPESYIIFSLLQNSHLQQSQKFAAYVQEAADRGPVSNNRGVKQANFLVLWRCTMPAVLVEIGFISNPSDLKSITGKANQTEIARNLYRAFVKYKRQYDKKMYIPEQKTAAAAEKPAEAAPVSQPEEKPRVRTAARPGVFYGIQIFSTSRELKRSDRAFKGWSADCLQKKGLNKYYIGKYGTREEAEQNLKKVRESFPNAFIIKLD